MFISGHEVAIEQGIPDLLHEFSPTVGQDSPSVAVFVYHIVNAVRDLSES
jgi:hypothetical protein